MLGGIGGRLPMTQVSVGPFNRRHCVVCGTPARALITTWTARCPACGTWTSTLEPAINEDTRYSIDDVARVAGLERLRRQNFAELLDRIDRRRPLAEASLLDVGCAYGWFLQEAARRGARAIGVEPDEAVADQARAGGAAVRTGWFPDALQPDERFDVISFNDVLEHLPDVRGALAASAGHLAPRGLLTIAIPTSDGIGYRVATALARLGATGPYERFWQAGLPSPHTYYFPRASLVRLLREAGFAIVSVDALTAVVTAGLWARVHIFRRPTPMTVASYLALLAARPILNQPRVSDVIQVIATPA